MELEPPISCLPVGIPVEKDKIVFSNRFYKFLVVGEAALAANLLAAWKNLWGGCTSSRLDHSQQPRMHAAYSAPKKVFHSSFNTLLVKLYNSRGRRGQCAGAVSRQGFSSRAQVGCYPSLLKAQYPGIQGSKWTTTRKVDGRDSYAPLDSLMLVFSEAALAVLGKPSGEAALAAD